MGFFSFIVLLAIAYLVWRVTDQLPDLIFRLSEVQRDVAEIRRRLADQAVEQPAARTAAPAGRASGEHAGGHDVAKEPTSTPGGTENPIHGGESGSGYTRT